jgi:hypothetical protein
MGLATEAAQQHIPFVEADEDSTLRPLNADVSNPPAIHWTFLPPWPTLTSFIVRTRGLEPLPVTRPDLQSGCQIQADFGLSY